MLLLAALVACGNTDNADMGDDPSGHTWELTDLQGVTPIEGTTLDMTIEDGTVHGSSGCNNYNGPATVDSGSMTLGPNFAVTFMACEQAIMDQEQKYLNALTQVTSYIIVGPDKLNLQDANGIEISRFQ